MSKQPPPAPIASAVGPCPTLIQISRASPHHPTTPMTGGGALSGVFWAKNSNLKKMGEGAGGQQQAGGPTEKK